MFKPGDTVIFNPKSFNPSYWDILTENSKIKYYGRFGYGCELKLFTYICEHSPQFGHCILMDMDTGELLPMCHTSNFRLVSDDEC